MEWTSNGPRSNLESGLVPGGRSVEHWTDPRQSLFDRPLRRCLCVVNIGVRLAQSLLEHVDSPHLDISEQILGELRLPRAPIAEIYVNLPQEIDRSREATR